MRCIPFLLLAYVVYYGLPSIGINLDNWTAGLCALVIYNTAYMAEIVRGSWARLPKEYTEAAASFGFHGFELYRRIVLPPIVLSAVPMIGNQVIQIVKDTAFLTIIAVAELTHEASSIQSKYYVPFAAFVTAVALYWVLCRLIETGVTLVERVASVLVDVVQAALQGGVPDCRIVLVATDLGGVRFRAPARRAAEAAARYALQGAVPLCTALESDAAVMPGTTVKGMPWRCLLA